MSQDSNDEKMKALDVEAMGDLEFRDSLEADETEDDAGKTRLTITQSLLQQGTVTKQYFWIAELRSTIPWTRKLIDNWVSESQFPKMLTLSYPVEFTILFLIKLWYEVVQLNALLMKTRTENGPETLFLYFAYFG